MILELIDEAVVAGARRARACKVAGLDTRTVERWRHRPDGDDLRRGPTTRPANALTADEEAKIVELATAPRAARRRHPNRWSRGIRNWTPIATVRLNPEHGLNS